MDHSPSRFGQSVFVFMSRVNPISGGDQREVSEFNGFDLLFTEVEEQVVTIDELLERSKQRKRGRVR